MYFSKLKCKIYLTLNLLTSFSKVKIPKPKDTGIISLGNGALGGIGLVWTVVVHEAVVRHELSEVKLGIKLGLRNKKWQRLVICCNDYFIDSWILICLDLHQ